MRISNAPRVCYLCDIELNERSSQLTKISLGASNHTHNLDKEKWCLKSVTLDDTRYKHIDGDRIGKDPLP